MFKAEGWQKAVIVTSSDSEGSSPCSEVRFDYVGENEETPPPDEEMCPYPDSNESKWSFK